MLTCADEPDEMADEPDEMAVLLPLEGLNSIDNDFSFTPITSNL
jgi:hypothetical protein